MVTVMLDRPIFGRPRTVSTPERERLHCLPVTFLPPALTATPLRSALVTTDRPLGIVTLSERRRDEPARARTVRRGDLPRRDTRSPRLGRRADAALLQLPTRFTAWLDVACWPVSESNEPSMARVPLQRFALTVKRPRGPPVKLSSKRLTG